VISSKIIQIAKDTHLAEFAHPGDEAKMNIAIALLDDGIKILEAVPQGFGMRRVLDVIQDGFVVFIHQDHHFLSDFCHTASINWAKRSATSPS